MKAFLSESSHKIYRKSRVAVLSAFALCALLLVGLAGCAMPEPTGDEQTSAAQEENATTTGNAETGTGAETDAVSGQEVTGVITEVGESELRIDASADSNEFLQGPVRVDFTSIGKDAIKDLKVGDTVVVQYSGQVGMSEPPYISATSIEASRPN